MTKPTKAPAADAKPLSPPQQAAEQSLKTTTQNKGKHIELARKQRLADAKKGA